MLIYSDDKLVRDADKLSERDNNKKKSKRNGKYFPEKSKDRWKEAGSNKQTCEVDTAGHYGPRGPDVRHGIR